MKNLQLTAYALAELKRNPNRVLEKGTHKIKLSKDMSQADMNLLFGPEGYTSAWVEEVPPSKKSSSTKKSNSQLDENSNDSLRDEQPES